MSTLDRRSFLTRGAAADGEVLFVNIQGNGSTVPGSGMTCAITGPWRRGAL